MQSKCWRSHLGDRFFHRCDGGHRIAGLGGHLAEDGPLDPVIVDDEKRPWGRTDVALQFEHGVAFRETDCAEGT